MTELYEITVSKGMTLSPGLHYDLMRTAVLVAIAGHLESLHFAQQCLDDMQHLGEASAAAAPPPRMWQPQPLILSAMSRPHTWCTEYGPHAPDLVSE